MRRLPQFDPDDVPSEEVHCFGCGRLVGVSPEMKSEVYCTELCRHQQQLVSIEDAARNRCIQYLVDTGGLTMTAVGEAFGMTRMGVKGFVVIGNNGDYLRSGRKPLMSDRQRANRVRAGRVGGQRRWSSE